MNYKYETDNFPFRRAKWFNDLTEIRKVRLVVIHSAEAPETPTAAEGIANYFADPRNKKGKAVRASAHVCVDSNSIVQCVWDNDVAYAAPGANHDGIQIELAGYAKQTNKEWLDTYGALLIENAANVTAQYCLKYDIPRKHLTNDELKNSDNKGIVGHYQVSEVYKLSDHEDPGPGFPWAFFIDRVAFHFNERKKKLDNQ